MNLEQYGWNPEDGSFSGEGEVARITAVHRERYEIVSDMGEGYARLKTGVYRTGAEAYPTVGDFVRIRWNPAGDSQIIATLPRRSFFSRRDPTPGRDEQAVAANFDTVLLLQSMNHDFNPARLERYAAMARQSGAEAAVVLTKADLTQEAEAYVRRAEQTVPGLPVHAVSAHTGKGMAALDRYLAPGRTLVLLGSSGVGKSSLINALAGEELMPVGGIREDDSKGRHTTTHRQLLMLPSGVMLMDTPGMRQLGMWEADEGLEETFADIEAFLGRCRFRDCRHEREPGCAIRAALDNGQIDPRRWSNYTQLLRESRYASDRKAQMQEKQLKFKAIAKANRRR